jgi:hypothetical protein
MAPCLLRCFEESELPEASSGHGVGSARAGRLVRKLSLLAKRLRACGHTKVALSEASKPALKVLAKYGAIDFLS